MKHTVTTLALLAGVNAHTLMSELYIDGKGQGSGTCIRQPSNPEGAVDPITDLSSANMICGKNGLEGVDRVCSVTGGSAVTFEYRQWPDDVSKGPLDEGHAGPCSVYLKRVDNAVQDSGEGDGWFKLWHDGYDKSSDKWCTQKMIDNTGRITVTLPDSLHGGHYLVRPELLALHNVHKSIPEFYVGCAQIFLQSSGQDTPESTVPIPGYITPSDSAVTFDIYEQPMQLPYTLPGPDVVRLMPPASGLTTSSNKQQNNDLPPDDCILTNANWCAVEIPDYSNEQGCWDADRDCWNQLDKCYDSAPPTGSANCKIWEQKCHENQEICRSSSPKGPINKHEILQPEANTISIPKAVNANLDYAGSRTSDANNSGLAKSLCASSSELTIPTVLTANNKVKDSSTDSGDGEDDSTSQNSASSPAVASKVDSSEHYNSRHSHRWLHHSHWRRGSLGRRSDREGQV